MYERNVNKNAGSFENASLFRDRNTANQYKMIQDRHAERENDRSRYNIGSRQSGTIVIRHVDQCYIIDQYSRGAANIFGFDDLSGRDLLHILEALVPLCSCLKKLVDHAPDIISPLVCLIGSSLDGTESCLMMRAERLMPDSCGRIVITLCIFRPDDSYFQYPQFQKGEIYYFNDDNQIVPLSDLESHNRMCTLSSYDQDKKEPAEREIGCFEEELGTNIHKKRINEKALKELTRREREILLLVLEGNTNKFISIKLLISEGTVKKTISNAYKKLNVSSRIELAMLLLSD